MALQINTDLTTKDGGNVSVGSHVKLETNFPMEGLTYHNSMKVWRSEQAYNDGLSSFKPVEIPNLNFSTDLTVEEYTGITPTVVHNYAKAYIEQYTGADTVEIIMNF